MNLKASSVVRRDIFQLQIHYELERIIIRAREAGHSAEDTIAALERAIENQYSSISRSRPINGLRLF